MKRRKGVEAAPGDGAAGTPRREQGADGQGAISSVDPPPLQRAEPAAPDVPQAPEESAVAAIARLEANRPTWEEMRKPGNRVNPNRSSSGQRWESFQRRMDAWERAMERQRARLAKGE